MKDGPKLRMSRWTIEPRTESFVPNIVEQKIIKIIEILQFYIELAKNFDYDFPKYRLNGWIFVPRS